MVTLRTLARSATAAGLFVALTIPAFGQTPAQPTEKKDAKADVKKDAKAKDVEKGAKDAVKENKETRDRAKESGKDVRHDATKERAAETRDSKEKQKDGDRRDATRDNRDDKVEGARRRESRDNTLEDREDARDRDDVDLPNREPREDKRDGREVVRDRAAADVRRGSVPDSDIRAADFGLWFAKSSRDDLVVSDVATSGAIVELGFREGDRIVSVDGQRVTRDADFMRYLLAERARNDRVKVIVLREQEEIVIWVEPAVLIEEYRAVNHDPAEYFGIVLDDRYDDRVVVWKVIRRSPAYYAGVRAGDVIVKLQDHNVANSDECVRILRDHVGGEIGVQVRRKDRLRELTIDLPEFQARFERGANSATRVDILRPNQRREERIEQRREERREERREPVITPPLRDAPPATTPGPRRLRLRPGAR